MCRGDGWQTEPWPLVRGKKTLEECSEVCKNRKGCTAFEMGPPEKKGRFKCVLYGHDEVQVADSLRSSSSHVFTNFESTIFFTKYFLICFSPSYISFSSSNTQF